MGHIHGYSRSCIHLLLRDEQHVETSCSFSMKTGEEKVGSLSPLFLKMRYRAQSCQNGWPSPEWMVGEQNCPQIYSLGRADGGALLLHPLGGGNKGHPLQAGTAGDTQVLYMGNDNPSGDMQGDAFPICPTSGLHWETPFQAMCCSSIISRGDPLVGQRSPRCLWQTWSAAIKCMEDTTSSLTEQLTRGSFPQSHRGRAGWGGCPQRQHTGITSPRGGAWGGHHHQLPPQLK